MKSSALSEALKMHKTSLKDGKKLPLMSQVCCKMHRQGVKNIHKGCTSIND